MKNILRFSIIGTAFLLTSCFGQHNNAPNPGANLDSERIYGVKGADPKQLEYTAPEDDGTVGARIREINSKLYPATENKNLPTITLDIAVK